MAKAWSYIRFSSMKQKEGDSTDRQKAMVAKWRDEHPEYEYIETAFEDLGVSGWTGETLAGGMGKLHAAVEAGVIQSGDVVVCEAIDRTGRMDTFTMMTEVIAPILKAGVSIITLDDGNVYDKGSLSGPLYYLLGARLQAANAYSEALSRRLRSVNKKKVQAAREGKGVKRRSAFWLTSDGEVIEEIAEPIAEAFNLYANGLGERRILARLREMNPVFNERGPSVVKKWLTNKTALGYWVRKNKQGEVIEEIADVYPAIVTPELFYTVQARIKAKGRPRSAPSKYFLSGLVRCGHCGRNFGVRSYKHANHAMACNWRTFKGADACENSKEVPYKVLEYVFQQTKHRAIAQLQQQQAEMANAQDEVRVRGELDDIDAQIERLVELVAATGGKVGAIAKRMTGLQEQRDALATELLIIEQQPKAPPFVLHVYDAELPLSDMELNSQLQQAGYAITCHADGTLNVGDVGVRFLGASRKDGIYNLIIDGTKHIIPLRGEAEEDYPYVEPFQGDVGASNTWTADDYENLRNQHE
ncbi:recombinase family protein [Pseudomonas sp. W03]|uniref:recombinase family protein n=1 Tax=Pseudomonas sp. W03 TaxID=3090666 RepID=UPI003A4E3ED0